MPVGLDVHLAHQRAGGIEKEHVALARLRWHPLGHAMGGKHHRRFARRNLAQLLDEHRAFPAQPLDYVFIVHDRVPHIDRRAILLERQLDDLDGPVHSGAETARRAERNLEFGLSHGLADAFTPHPSQPRLRRNNAAGTIEVQRAQEDKR